MASRTTPVMQQHAAAKRAYPDSILFFRLGDFYEMFEGDATLCARLLDLTLTSRNKGKPDEVPMAGVPHHAAHNYIKKLLDLGHKVAVCEQMADPATVKGIVPRQVVRVLTPGTVTHGEHLEAKTNNWLASIETSRKDAAVALLDLSTGELRAASFENLAASLGELSRARPREVIVGAVSAEEEASELGTEVVAIVEAAVGDAATRPDGDLDEAAVQEALGPLASDAHHLDDLCIRAVARALRYARACNPGKDIPVRRIAKWDPSTFLLVDPVAQEHLELVRSSAGARETTLLGVLDVTMTPPGARLLRGRLLAPLIDVGEIRRRLDEVELFVENPSLRADVRKALEDVGDLERLATRAALGEATPRDLGAIRNGLEAAREASARLSSLQNPTEREVLSLDAAPVDTCDVLAAALAEALVERPPAQAKEGAIFRPGYDAKLNEQDALRRHGAERMTALEAELRETTQITTLKVRYTRVFGWYVEVSRGHVARVPEQWRRKQTVASGERYTLAELDDLADRITLAEERYRERELELLAELVAQVRSESARIADLAARLATWDVAAALAEVAHRYDYRRPNVESTDALEIVDGRHPVVERLAAAGRFVPNDVRLDINGERMWVVTGPNMAGKSTLLRQTALIVILAQMGSFVPARAARVGIVDRVLSRVGASDNLARGESTFMVEMRETAEILRGATRRSLVILDEIGRGTSTFDGLAIAWAVAEYLDEVLGCRTLFATHYNELTELARASRHVENVSVSAKEVDDDIVFLHRLVRGPASRSYGVAVAKLAGLPESVLARARGLLQTLEEGGAPPRTPTAGQASSQLALFQGKHETRPVERELLNTLRELDIDRLAPLEALQLLARLSEKLKNG